MGSMCERVYSALEKDLRRCVQRQLVLPTQTQTRPAQKFLQRFKSVVKPTTNRHPSGRQLSRFDMMCHRQGVDEAREA